MVDEEKKEEENIGSFYIGRTRPPPLPKRFLPPGVLTLIALTALGGIIWYAYPRGADRYTNLDVPVVKADTAPIKEKPENPGGMEVSHQDSNAFDPLQKNGNAEVEKLAPGPEQPLDKDQVLKSENPDALNPVAASPNLPPQLDMQANQAAKSGATAPKMPDVEAMAPVDQASPAINQASPAPVTPPVALPTPKPEPENLAAAAPVHQPEEKKPVEEVKPKTETKKAQPKKEAAHEKPHAEKAAAGGDYEVQLGSYREEAAAKKDWSRLQKKYAAQLASLKMHLVKADIPGKGIYYRMRAGVMSKDRAHAICEVLKSDRGVGCILAKK